MNKHKPLALIILNTIIILGFSLCAYSQTQKGSSIDGANQGGQSGRAISMPDANTVAIGDRNDSTFGSNSGLARVFKWNGHNWIQKGSTVYGYSSYDEFGFSVSMPDSNTLAVGALIGNFTAKSSGFVRVFTWNGNDWQQKGAIIKGENSGDHFGHSVSMPNSNTIAIGAPENKKNGDFSGHVRVFKWNGSIWQQKGIDIDGKYAWDICGYTVSMPHENIVAIAFPASYVPTDSTGRVIIYYWNGNNWVQKGQEIEGYKDDDYFGRGLWMPDTNTIAIGGPGGWKVSSKLKSGYVRIFNWNGNSWIQKGQDIYGEAAGDCFGQSISMLDKNNVAIGAPFNDAHGYSSGEAYVYAWNGNKWVQRGNDIEGDKSVSVLGTSVSMPDRYHVGIGIPLYGTNYTGQTRVYTIPCNHNSNSISMHACGIYHSPSGKYSWTESGIYIDTILNTAGCDSIITINITVDKVDVSVTNISPTLTANASGASYQWLDCNNYMSNIKGETFQTFTATRNGSYAVEITQNGCIDTSECEVVNNMSIMQNDFGNSLVFYPNPNNGDFTLDFGRKYSEIFVIVRNKFGQLVNSQAFFNTNKIQINTPGKAGVYFIEVNADNKKAILKLMKE